jgi:hypothetical protein
MHLQVRLRQLPDDVEYQVIARGDAAAAAQDAAALHEYFNLSHSLAELAPGWCAACARYAHVHPHLPGARMLRQDPVECLFQVTRTPACLPACLPARPPARPPACLPASLCTLATHADARVWMQSLGMAGCIMVSNVCLCILSSCRRPPACSTPLPHLPCSSFAPPTITSRASMEWWSACAASTAPRCCPQQQAAPQPWAAWPGRLAACLQGLS